MTPPVEHVEHVEHQEMTAENRPLSPGWLLGIAGIVLMVLVGVVWNGVQSANAEQDTRIKAVEARQTQSDLQTNDRLARIETKIDYLLTAQNAGKH